MNIISNLLNANWYYYLTCVAKLGGYPARKGDPPPGNMVMWRGITRLADIVLGLSIAEKIVGN